MSGDLIYPDQELEQEVTIEGKEHMQTEEGLTKEEDTDGHLTKVSFLFLLLFYFWQYNTCYICGIFSFFLSI